MKENVAKNSGGGPRAFAPPAPQGNMFCVTRTAAAPMVGVERHFKY